MFTYTQKQLYKMYYKDSHTFGSWDLFTFLMLTENLKETCLWLSSINIY